MAWFDLGSSYEDPDEKTTYHENGEKKSDSKGSDQNIQVESFSENKGEKSSVEELVEKIEQKINDKDISKEERLTIIRETLTGQPVEIQRRALKRASLGKNTEEIMSSIETTGNELNRVKELANQPKKEGISKGGQKDAEPHSEEGKKANYSRSSGHSNADAVNPEEKERDQKHEGRRKGKHGKDGDPRVAGNNQPG